MAIALDPARSGLAHGFHPVAPGDLAAVVTALEMTAPPAWLARPGVEADVPLHLVRWEACTPDRYRLLYRRIGAPWLWWSRLALDDAALAAIIDDPAVEIYAVTDRARVEIGMVELDFRQAGACEIAFFGFVAKATGKGFGNWLMRRALQRAWAGGAARAPISRVWVHTCTLDDPRAVGFYQRHGFVPTARFVEVFRDPRAAGLLEPDSSAFHPLLQESGSKVA